MTNALRHTATRRPLFAAFRDGGVLKVVVTDAGLGAPVVRPFDTGRSGGNGMRIVHAYADEWGTIVHDGIGKSVWFDLAI